MRGKNNAIIKLLLSEAMDMGTNETEKEMNPLGFLDSIQDQLEKELVIGEANNTSTAQFGGRTLEIQQRNVVKFNEQIESIIIEVKSVKKINSLCQNIEEPKMPWAEVFLGLASLFAGAFISALISGIQLNSSWRSIVFYIISPVVAVGCGVAFLFLRKQGLVAAKMLAEQVVGLLPELDYDNEEGIE